VWGAVRMIQAVVPGMRARGGGTIVNMTSVAGRVGPPNDGFYPASKWALEGISEQLHYEVGHFGIRVRVIEPGVFATAFQGRLPLHGVDEPPYDELERQWLAGRDTLLGGGEAPGPEAVGATIADAVESGEAKLRWPVGADAELVVGARASMNDEDFETAMRTTLGIDW
jgi:NAD(P)-dependent dehydrogenase (short-subunit alcohol dehydrogenase family)